MPVRHRADHRGRLLTSCEGPARGGEDGITPPFGEADLAGWARRRGAEPGRGIWSVSERIPRKRALGRCVNKAFLVGLVGLVPSRRVDDPELYQGPQVVSDRPTLCEIAALHAVPVHVLGREAFHLFIGQSLSDSR